jgi:single-stranded DNA-binding protein
MTGLWAMAAGVLARDPEQRSGAKADFARATVRIGSGDEVQWISVLAFGEAAERLLSLRGGDAVSVAGRAELSQWTAADGSERSGVSIVASEVAAARPRPKPRDDDTAAARHPRRRVPYAASRPAPSQGDGRPFDDPLPL